MIIHRSGFFFFEKNKNIIKRRDMSKEIFYSDRYKDDTFEYRFVGMTLRITGHMTHLQSRNTPKGVNTKNTKRPLDE